MLHQVVQSWISFFCAAGTETSGIYYVRRIKNGSIMNDGKCILQLEGILTAEGLRIEWQIKSARATILFAARPEEQNLHPTQAAASVHA